ncbi:MAG: ABC-F family ATP-binding cassette domain-containing protein [Bacteroidales bacterium]|nr:ABC-F family ATP-binding cassette domain-containing protein [Bacteroidales bacterium]
MPSFLQIDNISKSYGTKVLFDHIGFNINEGDKIALVAPNGTGKTSLLRILAGKDSSDSGGSVRFLRDIRIAFLEQEYDYDPSLTVSQQIHSNDFDEQLRQRRILSELGLSEDSPMSSLSGGEIKRVAIAQLLARDAEFLIMDEPTNHLDIEAIEYLENALKRSRCTLFMVSHDRYFLDRVCNTVMEMDRGSIYIYRGDYENFLSKRDERISNYNAETDRVRNVLRRELEWIHATPCARSGKAKYRKQAFLELKERASDAYISNSISMDGLAGAGYLGKQVIDCKDLSFSWGDKPIVKDFTYNFQRGERVGIVGGNGIGKSTFLNLLADSNHPAVKRGESVRIGYYRQEGIPMDEGDTVMETVPDTRLLEKFLFPHEMWNNRLDRLSGGEKRRLYLLTILMKQPNVLILDEPTNDLDIVTLNILEEYLMEFKGTLVIVTHDRHFLDRLVDHLFVFCGNGVVKDFVGGYSEYRSFMEDRRQQERSRQTAQAAPKPQKEKPSVRKLTWKEQREMEALEAELEALAGEQAELEALLAGGTQDYKLISEASERYKEVRALVDEKETRWLELNEI